MTRHMWFVSFLSHAISGAYKDSLCLLSLHWELLSSGEASLPPYPWGVLYRWTPESQQAFDTLKDKLASASILVYPNFEILKTEPSCYGLGAVLVQHQADGSTHPIAYASRNPSSCQGQLPKFRARGLGGDVGNTPLPSLFVWPQMLCDDL